MDIKPRRPQRPPRRPVSRPARRPAHPQTSRQGSNRQTHEADNEWSEFYKSQNTPDDGVLWVERQKEKVDWSSTIKKYGRKLLDWHDNTDYLKLLERVLRGGYAWATAPVLKRTYVVLAGVSVPLFIAMFVLSGGGEPVAVLDANTGPRNITFEPLKQSEDDEVTIDTIVGAAIVEDDIDGAPIVISQQDLPQNVVDNPSDLELVAQSVPEVLRFESFTTEAGTAYVATKYDGTQVTIVAYENRLITITSSQIIYAIDWSEYINELIPDSP